MSATPDIRIRGLVKRFGDVTADIELLRQARADALTLVADDADLSRSEHQSLRQAVWQRYGQTLELSEVG